MRVDLVSQPLQSHPSSNHIAVYVIPHSGHFGVEALLEGNGIVKSLPQQRTAPSYTQESCSPRNSNQCSAFYTWIWSDIPTSRCPSLHCNPRHSQRLRSTSEAEISVRAIRWIGCGEREVLWRRSFCLKVKTALWLRLPRTTCPISLPSFFIVQSYSIMSRVGADLPGLQNLIKRDPVMYHEEFLQQVILTVIVLAIV